MFNMGSMMKKVFFIIYVSVLLGGCSSALNNLRGERSVGAVIDPGERLVIRNKHQKDGRYLICSEPPPDVASSIFRAISASIEGGVDEKAKGQAALKSISNNEIVKLFSRSQGIQGLRDGMYRSCEAFINGGIDEETYGQQMTYMTATLNFLVTVELCGKVLEAEGLTVQEATSKGGDLAKDQRAELYSECLDTAEAFAEGILKNSEFFQQTRRNRVK